MAYADDDALQLDAIELYEFVAAAQTWRLTTAAADYRFQGQLYTRQAMDRSDIAISTKLDSDEAITIEMPITDSVIDAFGFVVPPQGLSLTITRLFPATGNFSLIWAGTITSITAEGDVAKLLCPSPVGPALRTQVPTKHIQRLCNHTLYDEFCGINREDFDENRTIDSISDDGLVITPTAAFTLWDTSGFGAADQWYAGGEFVRDSTGERRLIVASTETTVTLQTPIHGLADGETFTAFAGCDKRLAVCTSKFANAENFGGFAYLPYKNIFRRIRGVADSV